MSEVQSRPAPRGRGSARGGRGGFSSRGGRGGRGQSNGDNLHADHDTASNDDDGEVVELKKKFGSKVTTIKDMFPDWTDADIVLALQETNGDLETTVDRIATGSITQWGEVSNAKKDRSKSKVKEPLGTGTSDATNQRGSRPARAGFEGGRGRGRGTERGRGRGGRTASTAHTNGAPKEESSVLPATTEASAWGDGNATKAGDTPSTKIDVPAWEAQKENENSWDAPKEQESHSVVETAAKAASSIIPEGVKKSWASMFAPAPAAKKEKVSEKAPEPVVEKPVEAEQVEKTLEPVAKESVPTESLPAPVEEAVPTPPPVEKTEPIEITPSKDELTETNLEQLPDTSVAPQTATAASTAASSWDPRNVTASSTPIGTQATTQPIRPPPSSGFQASAQKATGTPGRSASYQRRVLDQEEAVRMPGNREVDRAAVKFGAFNLGAGEEDVDGEREDAETRGQPPQHSPSAPRASLPPAPQQAGGAPVEAAPTPKQSTGLPAVTAPTAAPGLPSPAPLQSAPGASSQNAGSLGRYGQGSQESSSLPQKPHDAFGQQAPSQSPFDSYSGQNAQSQQHPSGAFSSAPGDYSSYYTSNEQRQAYNNYYQQQYGQGQEGPGSQQRAFGGYGPQSESTNQFPQSGSQQASSRYGASGEGQNSGHNTPNPTTQSQHQGGQPAQGGQPQQSGHPQNHYGGYGHPYYSSPYYAAYMNQQQQSAAYYNNPYGGKGGHYQQPYGGYGSPYEQHASSPAGGVFGGSSTHGRDSAASGLDSYGRTASAQSSQNQSSIGGSTAFGASHDTFGRSSGYPSQGGYAAQQGNPQASTDDLKPFSDSKTGNGPSPSLAHAGRPGSATNTPSSTGLPPPQSQQAGYGGYPHLQQQGQSGHSNTQGNSQYSGVNQAGQGHQSPYGGYGGFGYGSSYGNNNQQQQQQRGGWGGNYGN